MHIKQGTAGSSRRSLFATCWLSSSLWLQRVVHAKGESEARRDVVLTSQREAIVLVLALQSALQEDLVVAAQRRIVDIGHSAHRPSIILLQYRHLRVGAYFGTDTIPLSETYLV